MGVFKIDVAGTTNGFVVSIAGSAGGDESDQLDTQFAKLVALKPQRLVLDLAKLDYLSSAGISSLLKAHKQLKEQGGRLSLAAVPDPVLKVIKASRLDHAMPVFMTTADALR